MPEPKDAEAFFNYATCDQGHYEGMMHHIRMMRFMIDRLAKKAAKDNAEWHDDPDREDHADYHAPPEEQFPFELRDKVIIDLVTNYIGETPRNQEESERTIPSQMTKPKEPATSPVPTPKQKEEKEMAASPRQRVIEEEVLTVLSGSTVSGNVLRLPDKQLDRKLYLRVNEVLEALGGKWNRAKKCHIFDDDAEEAIENAILTRSFTKPGDFGFFPTPPEIADKLVAMAKIGDLTYRILEPSAGTGAIIEAIDRSPVKQKIIAVELLEKNYQAICQMDLSRSTMTAMKEDFLYVGSGLVGNFDRVIMNPPFAPKQADIDHILHAWLLLKRPGRLVSIMAAGVLFRENSKTVNFREFVKQMGGKFTKLPSGSFEQSGTGVETVILEIDKPV